MTISKEDLGNAKINESFGLSDDTLVNYVQNNIYGSRWWYYWKDDTAKIKKSFQICRDNGMSPAFVVVKEKAEGVGNTSQNIDGWGNHNDIPLPDPFEDLAEYCRITVDRSNSTAYNPAWRDEGNPVNCVPTDVIQAGNADFANTPTGTIKRAYVVMTAATTWAYYYPDALKKALNQVRDYGNPIQQCTDYLNEMGAKITGSGGKGDGGKNPEPNKPDIKPNTPDQNKPLESENNAKPEKDFTALLKLLQDTIKQILDLLKQGYFISNNGIFGTKTGVIFTRFQKFLYYAKDNFEAKTKSALENLEQSFKDAIDESGKVQDDLPNGINQTVEGLLMRAHKYLDSDVKYNENSDGRPENGATDNGRFMSWCVEAIHPSLKNSTWREFFVKFNSAGYVRHRGAWADIAKNLQIGDIICCADDLESDKGGKEYFIAIGNDECIEAYPWETGVRSTKTYPNVGKGIAKFKLSERQALGCADIAIVRVYSPKEVEKPTPPKDEPTPPPSSTISEAIQHIKSQLGNTIGSGQCYALVAEYAGFLGGPGLGAGTKYGLSGLSGQGSTSAAADIGICYAWSKYGWSVIKNPQLSQITVGCILNFNRSASVTESMGGGTSNWFSWTTDPTYGHTLLVTAINGDSLTVLEQWGGSRQYTMENTMAYSGTGSGGISSICIPPS